jgi:hypothetical protein
VLDLGEGRAGVLREADAAEALPPDVLQMYAKAMSR